MSRAQAHVNTSAEYLLYYYPQVCLKSETEGTHQSLSSSVKQKSEKLLLKPVN